MATARGAVPVSEAQRCPRFAPAVHWMQCAGVVVVARPAAAGPPTAGPCATCGCRALAQPVLGRLTAAAGLVADTTGRRHTDAGGARGLHCLERESAAVATAAAATAAASTPRSRHHRARLSTTRRVTAAGGVATLLASLMLRALRQGDHGPVATTRHAQVPARTTASGGWPPCATPRRTVDADGCYRGWGAARTACCRGGSSYCRDGARPRRCRAPAPRTQGGRRCADGGVVYSPAAWTNCGVPQQQRRHHPRRCHRSDEGCYGCA